NLLIILISLAVQLPLALALAVLLAERIRGAYTFRMIFFLPYVLAEIAAGLIWRFVYDGDYGLVASLTNWLGYPPVHLLADRELAIYGVLAVVVWKYFGFHMILYLAGLQGIPPELEDAARVDGATPSRVLRDITLPLLGPTIRVSAFFAVLGSLQFFDLIWVMTKGGPVNESNTMATYMYTYGFQRFQLGYGAAVSLVIFVICFGFSLAYQRFVMRRDLEGALT
ncbi:MAG: carbohydrate ABC transporter permease, partial [Thermomicrobiales bacterium]